MPRLTSSITVLLVLTAAIGNGSSTFPTEALLAKLHQLQVRNVIKRQGGSTGGNGSGISVNDFPAQCRDGCAPAINAFNTCPTAACLCTASIDSSLQYCITCSINAIPSPDIISAGQQVFDTYNSLCAHSGVKTLTLTNVPSGSLSASGAGSSSTSKSAIKASTPTVPPPSSGLGPTVTITAGGATPAPPTSGPTTTTGKEVAGIGTSIGAATSITTSLRNAALVAAAPGVGVTMGLVVAFYIAFFA